MDALIMNSLTYGFGLSIHLISYVFGSSLLIICIFVCEIDKNTAYLQLMSKRCTSSNSIISVTLMDSFNKFYGIYKLLSTALRKL